jgi:hypothetical protein
MSAPGANKQIKVVKSKLSNVLFAMQKRPLTEKEWAALCEAHIILGKIRTGQMAWLSKEKQI